MNKSTRNYGIIAGLFGGIFFVCPIAVNPEYYYDPNNFGNGEILGYSIMLISMVPVFLGTRSYRNKYHSDTAFSFGKAMGTAMKITVIGSAIFYICNILVYEVFVPEFLAEFGIHYKSYIVDLAETVADKQQAIADFDSNKEMMENGYLYALVMTSSVFLFGLIISLISAFTLKRTD